MGDIIIGATRPGQNKLTEHRVTHWSYEILEHDPASGVDSTLGWLDGVTSCVIDGVLNTPIKWSGDLTVTQRPRPAAGKISLTDINIYHHRVRPWMHIDGLEDWPNGIPWGIYVQTDAPRTFTGIDESVKIGLNDKTIRLAQDSVTETFVADDSKPILQWVQALVQSAGETVTVDLRDTQTGFMIRPAGTSKLEIINDLLKIINFNSITIDRWGQFVVTPIVKPSQRPSMFNWAPKTVYTPNYTIHRDLMVPNRVVALSTGTEDEPPLAGIAENHNADSDFSIEKRNFVVSHTLDGQEVPDGDDDSKVASLEAKALQSLIAMSSPAAATELTLLPQINWLGDVGQFNSARAKVDALNVITKLHLESPFDALMDASLQEVITI